MVNCRCAKFIPSWILRRVGISRRQANPRIVSTRPRKLIVRASLTPRGVGIGEEG